MSSKPVPPNSANSEIHHWLLNLRRAMDDGDTNPHLVMRDIVGEVYARGYHDGYTASLFDRPLDPPVPACATPGAADRTEGEQQ